MSGNDAMRTVALASTRPGWARSLVASMPRTLRRVDAAVADIVLVDGVSAWTALAAQAVGLGARSLVVVDPGMADPDAVVALADAADRADADIALVGTLADSPALGGLRDLLDGSFGELVLDGETADGLADLALIQLRLLRGLGLDEPRFATIATTAGAFVIEGEGRLGATIRRVRLTGAVGAGSACITVTAHAATATAGLAWRGGAEARPVAVTLADAAGLRSLPAIHEGGHRYALRALLSSADARCGSGALRAFGRDLDLLHGLLGVP